MSWRTVSPRTVARDEKREVKEPAFDRNAEVAGVGYL